MTDLRDELDTMHRHDQPHRRATTLLVVMLIALATVMVHTPRVAHAGTIEVVDGDIIESQPYAPLELFAAPRTQTLDAGDPLNLVLYPNELRRYSLGIDVFEVWECPDAGALSTTAAQFAADAEANVSPYFVWLSHGKYDPDFIVGGAVPLGQDCSTYARANATGRANAALFIRSTTGGYAGPGFSCPDSYYSCPTTYPENVREGFIGIDSVQWTTLAHEMGHMLSWPHSSAGSSSYDNAIDLMSGNYGIWYSGTSTRRWGTYPRPYATVAVNRYGAGWYDLNEVVVWDGTDTVVTIGVTAGTGNQALIIDEGASFYTFDLRISQTPDPFPSAWTGVEVYEVQRCSSCWGLNAKVAPIPAVPFDYSNLSSYSQPLPHVLVPGGSVSLGAATVTLVERRGATATLQIYSNSVTQPPPSTTRFRDVPESHTFFADIEWLADRGITKGCNPPTDDRFCPDSSVTRGQMAAFLVRALNLPATSTDFFTDDAGSTFEADINRLAAAGITKGCNPPFGDHFCPDARLSRAQMAALLVRALGYTNPGPGDLFVDDDGSIYETDIDKLATAGVTKGCNPPTNDRFCPNEPITRAQMAAFLHRALG